MTPNFYTAVIVRGEWRVAILAHRHLALLALAVPPAKGEMEVRFVEEPEVAAVVAELGSFRLMSMEELRTPLDQADLSALAEAELAQVAYWKPHTVGELVFNYWD
ncbi:hypothetical protein [Spirillospora sp. NPDC029432]|uniref:hypothetical protein n=1 Tax=Spirillospora sp. NPDC029432 TaxID=3154599 RepID=UPI00345377CA